MKIILPAGGVVQQNENEDEDKDEGYLRGSSVTGSLANCVTSSKRWDRILSTWNQLGYFPVHQHIRKFWFGRKNPWHHHFHINQSICQFKLYRKIYLVPALLLPLVDRGNFQKASALREVSQEKLR